MWSFMLKSFGSQFDSVLKTLGYHGNIGYSY